MADVTHSTGAPQRLKGRSFAETRSAILDLIRSEDGISRSALARRSSLTEKTISGIVRSLLEAGVIVEAEHAESTGGKRPILLRLSDQELYAVGISLDIARCLLVICALDGTEVARSELGGTAAESPPAVLKRLTAGLNRLLRRRGLDKADVVGICVAMGGRRGVPVSWEGDVSFADLWEPFATEDELARLTGLPVIKENDANCAALGEYWTTGSATRDFATIYMASGIGCGIVIGGSLYRGASGNAGEIGHTLAETNGAVCWCGRRGCLDTIASPRAITEQIRRNAPLRQACAVSNEMTFAETYASFADAVRTNVAAANEVFARAADHLAHAVLDLVNTLDLDLISLSGPGFAGLENEYRDAIDHCLNKVAFMRDVHSITVRSGVAGADAAALGAASVVLHREFTPHHSVSPL